MGVLTRGGLRRRLLLLAAFAAALVVATSTFAVAQTGGGGSGFELNIAGTMTLELADGDQQVTFGAATPQSVTVKRGCELDPVAGPLLSVDASGGALGTFDGDIGVKGRGKAGNGQPCGQANSTSESLTVRLGSAESEDPSLDGLSIAHLDLGVEAKFNVTIKVVFLDEDGNEYGDAQGDPIAYTFTPSEDSDSGPDSADSFIEPSIGPGFGYHGVRLEVDESSADAAFSLETTVFYLTDDITGVLACGPTVSEGNVDLVRTTSDQTNCQTLIPYIVRLGAGTVFLDKDLSVVPDESVEEFTTRVTWASEEAKLPVPVTQIDFDGDPSSGLPPQPVEWCNGTTMNPEPASSGALWCLYQQSVTLVGGGQMEVVEDYLGSGDPFWARG